MAVEPEPHLRAQATEAARTAPVRVRVVDCTAARLPAENGSADAVAISGLLCSVPDPRAALEEFRRVLRPGGQTKKPAPTGSRLLHCAVTWATRQPPAETPEPAVADSRAFARPTPQGGRERPDCNDLARHIRMTRPKLLASSSPTESGGAAHGRSA
ncbi:class I SAM-dependent methyltransferase [Actinoallomurus iriomotensis]|uniref:Methyltransferase type 11 domain-containing protein n=1 Tax=Actinoallomurus iriomotensis TaxID=478107 RepID=A0A9W6SEG4_9ACTN|nr:class I SAM-dependent methyltransferase [Actinoallomurus iriomotensis]GLY92374.1 hypothetical protein Airi02_103020 [Actinoallomurus iriomotensis]